MSENNTDTKKNKSPYVQNSNLFYASDFQIATLYFSSLAHLILFNIALINKSKMDIVNNIIAPLIVAIISAGFGWLWGIRRTMKKVEAAPKRYIQELDNLIIQGVKAGEANAILNARAIVSTRNSLRVSLVSLSKHLNSEIDRLAKDIGETIETPLEPSKTEIISVDLDAKRAYETIQVLAKIWPAKKVQIEYEISKLLTELGIS